MMIIKADGSKWRLDKNSREQPYRWYHGIADRARMWWFSRDWRRRQREFARTGTRYYGDGGTIHHGTTLDIETDGLGHVVAVWFRCQSLPFRQSRANAQRAADMRRMYHDTKTELHGVEVRDGG